MSGTDEGAGQAREAMQVALAAEHAAVHVLGALGAATSLSATPDLYDAVSASWARHRDVRDALVAAVTAADGEPVGSEAAYELPALGGPDAVARAAADVELATAGALGYLVATSTGGTRRRAALWLADAAVAAVGFGSAPEPLPGVDDA